jgi:2-polyprenyl-6-hydroxyphenyl methylase/3-demethylubiquinone-9 3-methyltransferase
MMGPFEWRAAEMYRSVFFSVDELIDEVAEWTPAQRILEVGAGEGRVAEALKLRYPAAEILGIDIDPRVGRLYRGDPLSVSFKQATVEETAGKRPHSFDLILICDVLHHVPWREHGTVLRAIGNCLEPGGHVVLKDWVRTMTPIHWMNYLSDRVVTGDRIRYGTPAYFADLVEGTFGAGSVAAELRLPPWRNNFALFVDSSLGCPPPQS